MVTDDALQPALVTFHNELVPIAVIVAAYVPVPLTSRRAVITVIYRFKVLLPSSSTHLVGSEANGIVC